MDECDRDFAKNPEAIRKVPATLMEREMAGELVIIFGM